VLSRLQWSFCCALASHSCMHVGKHVGTRMHGTPRGCAPLGAPLLLTCVCFASGVHPTSSTTRHMVRHGKELVHVAVLPLVVPPQLAVGCTHPSGAACAAGPLTSPCCSAHHQQCECYKHQTRGGTRHGSRKVGWSQPDTTAAGPAGPD
jgi:hypothetical protein